MNNSVFSFENLHRAYLRCRKNKRSNRTALQFELNAEEELLKLSSQLQERAYRPLPSACFVTRSPKPREIFAARFRDRVVHHLLISCIEAKWERIFVYDSYACRRNKGIHAAVKRLQSFMRKVSRNRSCPAFYLQIDIKSFFVSINKRILFHLLRKKENNPDIIWLLELIIFHDPTKTPDIKGDLSQFNIIPDFKSLFFTRNRRGLPIGNFTSQFFANVYLNEIDQFVKHHLKCSFYLRYVDDLVLLSQSREELEQWEKSIIEFLKSRLALVLNRNRRKLAPISNGCDFLGYIVRPTHLLIRNRCVNNLKQKLKEFAPRLEGTWRSAKIIHYTPDVLKQLQAVLASYLGLFQHGSSFNLINTLFNNHPFLKRYFVFKNNKLCRLYHPPRFRRLSDQYNWFYRRHRDKFIFFQVGMFYEFYGGLAESSEEKFNLKKGPPGKRLGVKTGFPVYRLSFYAQKALAESQKVIVISQTGSYSGNVMERRIRAVCSNRDN